MRVELPTSCAQLVTTTGVRRSRADRTGASKSRLRISSRASHCVGIAARAGRRAVTDRCQTGLTANPVVVQIAQPSVDPASMHAIETPQRFAHSRRDRWQPTALVDKPPPLAVSVYEPVYFLVGGDGGLNAKFQISLRFRLFDDRGRLARRLPWIDDLYLSFSQTSLWDLGELSKPFKDSSYRPRLFYANYDLARTVGRATCASASRPASGHESNGKEGEDSRSFNMLYVRPTLTFGDPRRAALVLRAADPQLHRRERQSGPQGLSRLRRLAVRRRQQGRAGFLGDAAQGRRAATYGSIELNASYPLSKLSGGDLTGWLMLQYFDGYGESLLDYHRKLDSQLRLGIAIAL